MRLRSWTTLRCATVWSICFAKRRKNKLHPNRELARAQRFRDLSCEAIIQGKEFEPSKSIQTQRQLHAGRDAHWADYTPFLYADPFRQNGRAVPQYRAGAQQASDFWVVHTTPARRGACRLVDRPTGSSSARALSRQWRVGSRHSRLARRYLSTRIASCPGGVPLWRSGSIRDNSRARPCADPGPLSRKPASLRPRGALGVAG